eukprot:CAMPEP_0179174796 /NCGR_PEP_ID=MMETSP0796-20121207/86308_1 /TAXON_ID=73915 /ORGANISM="Pyrodinium bahamense, Strain pbaha01" /LENGTH=789 /DNA_ID=CAMNT_0020878105 /DNA_START=16 /DNA_END=2386 /DNA_ORIENTATION=+
MAGERSQGRGAGRPVRVLMRMARMRRKKKKKRQQQHQSGHEAAGTASSAGDEIGGELGAGEASPDPAIPPEEVYPPHLRSQVVEQGLKTGRLVQGELQMTKNTCYFGYVQCGAEEIVVSGSRALNRAVDGDTVVVERLNAEQAAEYESAAKRIRHQVGGRSEADDVELALEATQSLTLSGKTRGRVVSIVKRNKKQLVGTLQPQDAPQDTSRQFGVKSLQDGDRIFVPAEGDIPTRLSGLFSEYPRGQWTRTLGTIGDIDVETEMILMEHNVKYEPFTEEVEACLPPEDFHPGPQDIEGREDFRGICVCSIDPPGCEDIDDALSCEALPNGNFRVGVHIADVTHFVHADTAIDTEAAERGTSVYMVDRRIDMFPKLLTTDICSLRAGGDRLAFSAVFEMTPGAEVVSQRFCKSVIRSRAALSYKEAQERLDGVESDKSDITQAIRRLNKLAIQLRAERMRQGAVELASDEIKFEVDSETQLPTNLFKYETVQTNSLIEEFMLLANRAVAQQISTSFRKLSVLRRHPPPKDDGMAELGKLLACHGVEDFQCGSNKQLAKSLDRIEKPSDPFFNRLVRIMATRCMNEASYFCTGDLKPEKFHHYGLAMDRYTHFTSPIRRYADCLVHRFLAASLGIASLPEALMDRKNIADKVGRINYKHRMAQWADRASVNLHIFLYFKARGQVVAEGVVMRVSKVGMQVAVEDYGAEGLCEMPALDWLIIEERQSVHGRPLTEFEGTTIGVFDRVVVRIEPDLKDGRNRTLRFTFISLPRANGSDAEASAVPEEEAVGT